ncbi:MAG: MarR family transcriptional regulator [Desulfitobacteriia bacterium]
MMLLTERYKDQIKGVLSCYDRILIHGNIPELCYAGGMTSYLYSKNIKIFDYPSWANDLRDEIRTHAEQIAKDNKLDIEFIRKVGEFRKDNRIQEIIKTRGDHPGLIHIFSAMESCNAYKPWHDKTTGKTFVKNDSGKCLHYYFYFIDPDFGLCYLRVPTWSPFRLQFYMNGHNWLASRLEKQGIAYEMRDNAFVSIDDWEKAQHLSDHIRVEDLHQVLDILANRYCPAAKKLGLMYRWSIMQVEYATDIAFEHPDDLKFVYDTIVHTAIHSVKPDNIATFLGAKLHWKYEGEMGNQFNQRILGTRIKHHMGAVSIKMYDKFGSVLRIETTANDVSQFKISRDVQHRDGTVTQRVAPMKKNIYSLFPLAKLLLSSNRRYLELVSSWDDPSNGAKKLEDLSESKKENGRRFKGFNFFSQEDQTLFRVLSRGEFNINGFQNKSIRRLLPELSPASISRILKRLRIHGIVKKVAGTRKYYLTKLGKSVITLGLKTKELIIIPGLAEATTN